MYVIGLKQSWSNFCSDEMFRVGSSFLTLQKKQYFSQQIIDVIHATCSELSFLINSCSSSFSITLSTICSAITCWISFTVLSIESLDSPQICKTILLGWNVRPGCWSIADFLLWLYPAEELCSVAASLCSRWPSVYYIKYLISNSND